MEIYKALESNGVRVYSTKAYAGVGEGEGE